MASLFTSESVSEGHPDKVADQISDAILDAILAKDPLARVACETAITTGLVIVLGEITTDCYVDIPRIIRQTVREVGYTRAKYGFDAETCGVITSIDEQSPDIAQGVDVGGAGDSGMVFGFACDETPELMPLPIIYAHRLARRLAEVRRTKALSYLRPDGKVQVTIRYGDNGEPPVVDTVVLSTQHHEEVTSEQLRSDVAEHVIDAVIPAELKDGQLRTFINPTGRFVVGGPVADAGLTGRKIMVDTYGGYARHGGGCFSGKDPTKVDRAGAYGARHGGQQAVRPEPARDHQGAQPQAAAVPPDRGLRPLRSHRHRRAMGIDRAGQGAGGRGRLNRTFVVIPAGGAGTRLWPRSRRSTPKHVLPLGDRGRPLLRETYERARSVANEGFVLSEVRQREIIEAVLPEVDATHLILEPSARGTTNAYGLATLTLAAREPDAVMVAMPADHVVRGGPKARSAVRSAVRVAAATSSLVTVGLKPAFPSTGLGYIHATGRARGGAVR